MSKRLIHAARTSGTTTTSRMTRAAGATKAAATHVSGHGFDRRWRGRSSVPAVIVRSSVGFPNGDLLLLERRQLGCHVVQRLFGRLLAQQRLLDGGLQGVRELRVVGDHGPGDEPGELD